MKTRKKDRKDRKFANLREQIKESPVKFAVYLVLRAIVIAVLVLCILRDDWESVFTCVLTLILFLIPIFVEKSFGIDLPNTLEMIILLFVFAAEILGEIGSYYIKYPLWDTMLHTINGFICAAFGFALVDIFNRNRRIKFELSPVFLAIVAFCFSMTIGVLWEFLEYAGDQVLNMDMQKDTILHSISSVMLNPSGANTAVTISGIEEIYINGEPLGLGGYLDIGLHDTMKDLFVNLVGAVVFSVIGFFYVKNRGRGRFARRFIPTVPEPEQSGAQPKARDGEAPADGRTDAEDTVNGQNGPA